MENELTQTILDWMHVCIVSNPRLPNGNEKTFFDSVERIRGLKEIPSHLPADARFPEHYNGLSPGDRIVAILVDAGSYLSEKGREGEAEPFLERALEIDPTDSDAHRLLAIALGVGGKPLEAIKHFMELMKANPADAMAYCGCGDCYVQMGDVEQAVRSYKRAYGLDPSNPVIQSRMARLRNAGLM
jgi:tetratricopeptide (TPR) repeat protein